MVIKMESVKHYKEICGEIDSYYTRVKDLERELKYLQKMMHTNAPKEISAVDHTQERVKSSRHVLPLDEIVSRMNRITEMLVLFYEILKEKEQARRRLEETISEFEGLDYKVAYLRAQGKSLIEIADELGYSYGWIRQISSRNKKRTTNEQTY